MWENSISTHLDPVTRLPYGASRYYAGLSETDDPKRDPIAAQYIPTAAEMLVLPYESTDPIDDNRYRVTARLVHHYPDRALLLANDRCATYCRHCFRRHFTGNGGGRITEAELEEACAYLASASQIREVLLSGGDPLMLSDPEVEMVLRRLKEVREDFIIRICTRLPVVLPSRITPSLCEILSGFDGIWAVIHTNHPKEVTAEFRRATKSLIRAGVPVLNQAVLLRGINDDPDVLETLLRELVRSGVKPYYLFQGDLAAGTSHFRVPIERGLELMRELRARLSGIALPTYAVDLPAGGGKVPIESSLVRIESDWYVFRGPGKKEYRYPREL